MGFKPFRLVHILARIGRPLLLLLGVKRGTVADKAAEAAEILAPLTPDDTDTQPTHTTDPKQ